MLWILNLPVFVMACADQLLHWYRFYPGVASSFDVPAIDLDSDIATGAISGPRLDSRLSPPSRTSTAALEEDDKDIYEEQDLSSTGLEAERNRVESQAARRRVILAKLKRVPKIVGSMNHAIIPMPPVSCFMLLHCAVFGLLPENDIGIPISYLSRSVLLSLLVGSAFWSFAHWCYVLGLRHWCLTILNIPLFSALLNNCPQMHQLSHTPFARYRIGIGITFKSIILEKNRYPCHGFSVMLRYRGQWG